VLRKLGLYELLGETPPPDPPACPLFRQARLDEVRATASMQRIIAFLKAFVFYQNLL
jgi:hypothetical protein